MAMVTVQAGARNKVLARCASLRCQEPLVRHSGASLSLLGKGNTLTGRQGEPLRLTGHCPACNKPYALADVGALCVEEAVKAA